MTDAEKLAYRRGYSKGYIAGSRRAWHEYRPPVPPDPIIGDLVASLQSLRDAVDNELAKLGPDEQWEEIFGPRLDAATEALAALGNWLKHSKDGEGEDAD